VRKERLELSHLSILVPKTSASTNSATFAIIFKLPTIRQQNQTLTRGFTWEEAANYRERKAILEDEKDFASSTGRNSAHRVFLCSILSIFQRAIMAKRAPKRLPATGSLR
jgi:hypothetical protein